MRPIDADALLKLPHDVVADSPWTGCEYGYSDDVINAQPTISPDEVRGVGKWINKTMSVPNGHGQTYNRWGCSVCKAKVKLRTNYCPNCGAKMEVSE